MDDYESWIEGGVMPTLNAFDCGDVRTTVMVFTSSSFANYKEGVGTLRSAGGDLGGGSENIAVLVRMREGKPGGGKGPLLSEDRSLTIATANDQTPFHKSDVRRLTPVECERLQGFPDDWTEGQPDSARYKQMGNAVAVPVVEWIIEGICDTLR